MILSLDIFGGRAILRTQTCHPTHLKRLLSAKAKKLERDGLMILKLFAELPSRVEYEITDLGKSLLRPTQGLVAWAKAKWGAGQKSAVQVGFQMTSICLDLRCPTIDTNLAAVHKA